MKTVIFVSLFMLLTGVCSAADNNKAEPFSLVGRLHDNRALNRPHDVELQDNIAYVTWQGWREDLKLDLYLSRGAKCSLSFSAEQTATQGRRATRRKTKRFRLVRCAVEPARVYCRQRSRLCCLSGRENAHASTH